MFVLIVKRVVKVNRSPNGDKFAPRTANETRLTASGPFPSMKAAQRAMLAVLATHTCLEAQVWNQEQIKEQQKKGSANRYEVGEVLREAVRLLDAASEPTNQPG